MDTVLPHVNNRIALALNSICVVNIRFGILRMV